MLSNWVCPLLFVGAKTQANYRLGVPRRVVTCTFQFTMQRVSEWLENEHAYLADGWTKSLTVCLVALGNPMYFRIEEPFKLWTMQEFNTSPISSNSPQFFGLAGAFQSISILIHANHCHEIHGSNIKLFIKALVKTFEWGLLEWGGANNQWPPAHFRTPGAITTWVSTKGSLESLGIRPYQDFNQWWICRSKKQW